ncbi:hypothetical protein V8E53_014028 [Lactarius tabidus]
MVAYLALTSHWVSLDDSTGCLTLKAVLIGFHHVKKKHSGANISKTILHLLDRANVTLKIGHFTLNNAKNNAVAMRELESLLAARKTAIAVGFDHLNHCVRCYAHIINICSSHIISSLNLEDFYNDPDPQFDSWLVGIKCDPLQCAQRIVRLLSSSDQRRESFRAFIQDGNEHSWFSTKDDKGRHALVQIPELQLLRDVKTQWDSVYMMLQHLRELRPVCSSC